MGMTARVFYEIRAPKIDGGDGATLVGAENRATFLSPKGNFWRVSGIACNAMLVNPPRQSGVLLLPN